MRWGTIELERGRPERASELFREACEFLEQCEGPHPSDVGACQLGLGRSLLASGQQTAAKTALEEAVTLFRTAEEPENLSQAEAALAEASSHAPKAR